MQYAKTANKLAEEQNTFTVQENLFFTTAKKDKIEDIEKEKDLLEYLKVLVSAKGLSLEALYKVCKGAESNAVRPDDFLLAITKLKFPLKEYQLRRLIVLIDEECTGIIRYEDYIQTMEAYGLLDQKGKTAKTNYWETCVSKLNSILQRRSMEPSEFFRMVATSSEEENGGTATFANIARVLSGLNCGLLHREIRGILNYLDINQGQPISHDDFVKQLKSAEKASKQIVKKPIQAWTQNQEGNPIQIHTKQDQRIFEIVGKMETTGICAAEFVGLFGQTQTITLGKVISKLAYCYPELTKEEKLTLGKSLPLTEGKVDLHELLVFLHQYSMPQKDKPVNIYYELWTNHIRKDEGTTPTEYFRKQGLKSNSELTLEDFSARVKHHLGLGDEICKIMWKAIVEASEQSMILEDLLQVLESYMNSAETRLNSTQVDFVNQLEKLNLNLQDVFNLACEDQENKQEATAITILRAFRKLLPSVDPQHFRNRMKEKHIVDLTMTLDFETFLGIFSRENNDTKGKTVEKRDSIYWINKLDNAMLDLGLSPTALFQKADDDGNGVITVNELAKLFGSIFPEEKLPPSELLQTMKALDSNRNGVIDFDEFANAFKNARSANIVPGQGYTIGKKMVNLRLPVFGNPVFVKLDEAEISSSEKLKTQINGIFEKIRENNLLFGECIENLNWDNDGKVTARVFMTCLEKLFEKCLDAKERYTICQRVDKQKTGFITVLSLLNFCNDNAELLKEDEKVILFIYNC